MSIINKLVKKLRGFARVQLRSYLLRRKKLLLFGYYPGFKLKFIPVSDKHFQYLKSALLRCRAFPGDLEIFIHMENEMEYLPHLTSKNKISVDVGANLGFYSAVLSPLSQRVFAFEASPLLQPYLTFNLYRFSNVTLLPVAASNSIGEIQFNIPFSGEDPISLSGLGGSNGLLMAKTGVEMIPTKTPCFPVDTLNLNNVGFLKIDVEGAELFVLQGAEKTIERCRPNVVIENEFRHNPDCSQVFDLLLKHNYQGYYYDRVTKKLVSFDNFSLEKNQKAYLTKDHEITNTELYVFNFIFVPKEADPLEKFLAGK
jgi:FkbM family methyltransferase